MRREILFNVSRIMKIVLNLSRETEQTYVLGIWRLATLVSRQGVLKAVNEKAVKSNHLGGGENIRVRKETWNFKSQSTSWCKAFASKMFKLIEREEVWNSLPRFNHLEEIKYL